MISNVTETKNNHLGIFYLGGSLLDAADIGTPYLPAEYWLSCTDLH